MEIAEEIFHVFNQAMSQIISNQFAEKCNAAAILFQLTRVFPW